MNVGRKIDIPDFHQFIPSMIVHTAPLEGILSYEAIYDLIPIDITDKEPTYKPRSREILLPTYSKNSIVSVKCRNIGSYRCQFDLGCGTFPNCTEIVISTGKEHLSVKIYQESILVSGSKKCKRTEKCILYLCDFISKIQKLVNSFSDNRKSVRKVYSWIKNETRSDGDKKITQLLSESLQPCKSFSKLERSYYNLFYLYYEEVVNNRKGRDYYLSRLKWIMSIPEVVNRLSVGCLTVNLKVIVFNLGIEIKLIEFRNKMIKHDELYVLYDSLINNNVMVKIYFSEDYIERHCFEVNKSGCVRMSSTCSDECEDAYYLFMSIVSVEYDS